MKYIEIDDAKGVASSMIDGLPATKSGFWQVRNHSGGVLGIICDGTKTFRDTAGYIIHVDDDGVSIEDTVLEEFPLVITQDKPDITLDRIMRRIFPDEDVIVTSVDLVQVEVLARQFGYVQMMDAYHLAYDLMLVSDSKSGDAVLIDAVEVNAFSMSAITMRFTTSGRDVYFDMWYTTDPSIRWRGSIFDGDEIYAAIKGH